MATITTQELKFDKSLNTTKALAILDINASKVQALYDSGQYSRVSLIRIFFKHLYLCIIKTINHNIILIIKFYCDIKGNDGL